MHKATHEKLPDWIKTKGFVGNHDTKRILNKYGVLTVCEKARCPNIGRCYARPMVTFMMLGSKCTRNCGFCSVESSRPEPLDPGEPERIALAAKEMGLRYVIITSVTRDDLPDGGAAQFARTTYALRRYLPDAKIELLTPDFRGNRDALTVVLNSRPHVYGHNLETVPRLYSMVRPQAEYIRSLSLLRYVKTVAPYLYVKSGLMVGLGEYRDEVIDVLSDLHGAGCDFVTIGQYLRPSKVHLPVVEYVRPEIFERLRLIALDMGFKYVASSPLVRSSLNAESSLL